MGRVISNRTQKGTVCRWHAQTTHPVMRTAASTLKRKNHVRSWAISPQSDVSREIRSPVFAASKKADSWRRMEAKVSTRTARTMFSRALPNRKMHQ